MDTLGLKLSKTRYAELAIVKVARDLWRVADITGEKLSTVGPHYRTKFEAFADLDRYAREYGATQVSA